GRVQIGYATLQAVEELHGGGCVHTCLLDGATAGSPSPYDRTSVCRRTPPQVRQVQRVKGCARGPADGLKDSVRERFRRHRDRVYALGPILQTEQQPSTRKSHAMAWVRTNSCRVATQFSTPGSGPLAVSSSTRPPVRPLAPAPTWCASNTATWRPGQNWRT